MKELNNINFKNDETKKSFRNSELIQISNKVNDLNQINNLNNETYNQINLSQTSENEFRINDTLYGNNYLNYYLNNTSSKKCFNTKVKKMGNLNVYFFINEQPLIVLGNKDKNLVIIYEVILQLSFILLMTTIKNNLPLFFNLSLGLLYLNCFLCHI